MCRSYPLVDLWICALVFLGVGIAFTVMPQEMFASLGPVAFDGGHRPAPGADDVRVADIGSGRRCVCALRTARPRAAGFAYTARVGEPAWCLMSQETRSHDQV